MPNLIGGVLCLDFVNTVDPRHTPGRHEYLDDYPADPAGAARVLDRAIRLREALYPLFSRAAQGRPPVPGDLAVLQAELTRALPHLRIGWSPAGFGREWEQDSKALDQVLWPVSWSAAELLLHGPVDRIRECPGQGNCGWLFLDLSKNASRRWCDMRVCGNRAKARRHYARTQGS
jgi:predicted RNA-binding Zn ribbon-like protein